MNIKLSMFSNLNDSIKASIRTLISFILIIVLFFTYLYMNKGTKYVYIKNKGNVLTNNFYIGMILLFLLLSSIISIQIPSNILNLIFYSLFIGIIIFGTINILLYIIYNIKINTVLIGTLSGSIFTMLISILTYMISNKAKLY